MSANALSTIPKTAYLHVQRNPRCLAVVEQSHLQLEEVPVFLKTETSNISCTLVANKIVDHSDVVGASPVGAALTTSSFSP